MYTFIVGREGNQPFPIEEKGVSRQHLQVTVPDKMDGTWIVQDLDSSNGTFIQNEDGSYTQLMGKQYLSWNTILRMGPDNIYGRTFWLCQLKQTVPNDFSLQFMELNRRLDTFIEEKKRISEEQEQQKKRSAIAKAAAVGVASLGLCLILPESWGMARFALLPVVGAIIPFWLQNKKNDKPTKDYKTVFRCPNGKCGRPLTEYDIRHGQCPACKAHM